MHLSSPWQRLKASFMLLGWLIGNVRMRKGTKLTRKEKRESEKNDGKLRKAPEEE